MGPTKYKKWGMKVMDGEGCKGDSKRERLKTVREGGLGVREGRV